MDYSPLNAPMAWKYDVWQIGIVVALLDKIKWKLQMFFEIIIRGS